MKKNRTGWWAGCSAGVVVFALVVLPLAIDSHRAHMARKKILAIDRHNLQMACREMIENYDQYKSNWPALSGDRNPEVAVISNNIPTVIEDIDPIAVFVGRTRVVVNVYAPPRTGFIVYATGADKLELDMLNRIDATELTNGIWMFTH